MIMINIMIKYKDIIVMFCAIWYHLHDLKNVKNTHGGVFLMSRVCRETKVMMSSSFFCQGVSLV